MKASKLPPKLMLPSGSVVRLLPGASQATGPANRAEGAPLFSEVEVAIASGRVAIIRDGKNVDAGTLVLRDFHVLRAVLARSAVIAEEEIEIACRNCGAAMRVLPCAALEIAPWVDGELDDPELDATLPFGEPVDVPAVALGRVRTARTVTFAERTVADARPLFAAAAEERLDVTADVVRAMGIVALGAERDASRIATALAECDKPAFLAVGDAFLATHYVARLGCVVLCEECGARNDVDAPYERESGGRGGGGGESESESGSGSESEGVVEVDVLDGPDGDAQIMEAVGNRTFRISAQSDRIGTRLEGDALPSHPMHDARNRAPSRPMVAGAIELTPAGLVVLGPDHPTTGGYPVIAVVPARALGRLLERPIGARVRFVRIAPISM